MVFICIAGVCSGVIDSENKRLITERKKRKFLTVSWALKFMIKEFDQAGSTVPVSNRNNLKSPKPLQFIK